VNPTAIATRSSRTRFMEISSGPQAWRVVYRHFVQFTTPGSRREGLLDRTSVR
jgi:hypothetical protein